MQREFTGFESRQCIGLCKFNVCENLILRQWIQVHYSNKCGIEIHGYLHTYEQSAVKSWILVRQHTWITARIQFHSSPIDDSNMTTWEQIKIIERLHSTLTSFSYPFQSLALLLCWRRRGHGRRSWFLRLPLFVLLLILLVKICKIAFRSGFLVSLKIHHNKIDTK